MLDYAGKQKRKTELFQNQSLGAKAKRLFSMNEVENLLLAHRPAISNTIQQAMQGKLTNQRFPALQPFNF